MRRTVTNLDSTFVRILCFRVSTATFCSLCVYILCLINFSLQAHRYKRFTIIVRGTGPRKRKERAYTAYGKLEIYLPYATILFRGVQVGGSHFILTVTVVRFLGTV